MGFFEKIKQGLKRTRDSIGDGLNGIFATFRKVDEDLLEELEELLILADVGFETTEKIIDALRDHAKKENIDSADRLKETLEEILTEFMEGDHSFHLSSTPSVILVVGVNGVGKTTTIGKFANRLKGEGKSVLIAAADTFRAAAIEQLEVWAERADVPVVRHAEGSDPAAVVYDGIQAAKSRGMDVLICDTAGRLHNKKNLMEELSKIMRIIRRELPDADTEVLLVLDATTGSNAVEQAKYFNEVVPLTGIVLTKLDGTAKGGVTLAVKDVTGVPIKLVCVGEQIDDLQYFSPAEFAKALTENKND
ncbi:MAG: signal recognition particle-docking protein FtsY [Clostridia bacterium]|nr:signal recognition particle-docking protein FtsY [Clostridia bacterium]